MVPAYLVRIALKMPHTKLQNKNKEAMQLPDLAFAAARCNTKIADRLSVSQYTIIFCSSPLGFA